MTQQGDEDEMAIGLTAIWCLALALAACVLVWLASLSALALDGQGPHNTPLSSSPEFVFRLVQGTPAENAWADSYVDAEPLHAGTFWWVLVSYAALVLATSVWVLLTWPHSKTTASDPAHWAGRSDERRMAVRRKPTRRRWRLVAGRGASSHRLLAGADCVSAVAFGPNGSGKTTGLIVPNVLDWDGPVVLTTAKVQDLEPICTARAQVGPVWIVAPGGAEGHETVGWSPVAAARDPETADRVAEWMVDSSGMTSDPKGRPWNAQARKYLKGLLLASHLVGGGISQWIRWIHAGERVRDHVEEILRSAGHESTAQEYASTWLIHEDGKGSVLFTALGLADTYSRPGIMAASDSGGFSPTDLLDRTSTLCIVSPSGEGERFAPYFTTVVGAIIHEAESRAAAQARPIEPRLLLALDEAGNVFRYPRLPHLLTTARGNGIQLLLIYHDLAQLEHLYGGREVGRTVLSNAKMRMLLPGVGDLDTLKYWSDLMGRTLTESEGTTTSHDGRRSQTRNQHEIALAPPHVLQQLPDGEAIVLYQNLPPARVRLLPWFADRRFRHLKGLA
ncbi:type IV secretory system conjugative DNA transfer family protein [Marmoricola sp. URHB0036]|uniref:type IV secretory system conjugative DNA transfer family protein n=1 Tax=Marmoricola sp. URHB0036 TaxID=1298863 RepID=UPI0012DCDCB1|nr:type IV secretory system conjugative DNA transfer family protein [Marmoricola sp. URHB0036]